MVGARLAAAGAWRWRGRRRLRHRRGDRPAVLPARRPAPAEGGAGRSAPLAAACRGASPAPSCCSRRSAWPPAPLAPSLLTAAAVDRAAAAVRAALHRAILDRVHLDRARQRPGRAVRRHRLQPDRHPADPAARRAAAARPGRLFPPWRRRRGAAVAWCRSPPASLPAPGSPTGPAPTRPCSDWSIAVRSCWWSMPRSARA